MDTKKKPVEPVRHKTKDKPVILAAKAAAIEVMADERIKMLQDNKGLYEPSDEQLKEVDKCLAERERVIEKLSEVTNGVELIEWRKEFIEVHKSYLRALGLKPCKGRSCTRYLTGRQQKYCSAVCRNREKQNRNRENHPDKKIEREIKYLESVKALF